MFGRLVPAGGHHAEWYLRARQLCTIAGQALKRRKVILVGAFNGSDFYGSYASPDSSVRTVDSALWGAAAAAGRHTHNNAALEMSSPPSDSALWSRASRTDKGVGQVQQPF